MPEPETTTRSDDFFLFFKKARHPGTQPNPNPINVQCESPDPNPSRPKLKLT